MLGCPDVCIPIPKAGYGALYIELKIKSGGVVSDNQKNVIEALTKAGNLCLVACGADRAIGIIEGYLE